MRMHPPLRCVRYATYLIYFSLSQWIVFALTGLSFCFGATRGNQLMATLTRPIEPVENRLLTALPRDEYDRLLPQLQQVSFDLGEVVSEFGGHLDYVYFPTTAIVSLLYTMEN